MAVALHVPDVRQHMFLEIVIIALTELRKKWGGPQSTSLQTATLSNFSRLAALMGLVPER